MSGRGVKALAALLTESPSLLCLDLSGNNLWSRLSYFAPASLSALAPLGRALASPGCKLQLLHLDQADVEPKGLGSLVDGLPAGGKGPSTLFDDTAPAARLVAGKAQAAPADPRARPEQFGSLPWTQQLASGRP